MLYLVEFFISLLINLYRCYSLLHVTQDHVQVLIVGLRQTTNQRYEIGGAQTKVCKSVRNTPEAKKLLIYEKFSTLNFLFWAV